MRHEEVLAAISRQVFFRNVSIILLVWGMVVWGDSLFRLMREVDPKKRRRQGWLLMFWSGVVIFLAVKFILDWSSGRWI